MTRISLDPVRLLPEETFLWRCARRWRRPETVTWPEHIDGERLVQMTEVNRMQTLMQDLLTDAGLLDGLSPTAQSKLQVGAAAFADAAGVMGESLHDYLQRAANRGIETAVLKGLSVSINTYGQAAMRPGGDIDILVRRQDVEPSLEILEAMGIGQNWPNLMADAYYERHHLHQQRCTKDLKLWYEIHWALDHPLTKLTIDYEKMMDRATPGHLLGAPVQNLSPPDLLLSLAIHLVKHAVYLPSVLDQPDLARIILADGMLMYFLDIAEVIKQQEAAVDWEFTVQLAQESGAVAIMGSVMQVCRHLLDAPVPAWVLAALPVPRPGRMRRGVMQRVAAYETAVHLGQPPSRLWKFLLVTNGAFILRPIRLLDLTSYCFPGRDYLCRRYQSDSWLTAVRHFLRALGQYGRIGVDTLYFTWERYRRLKRLKQSTSLFNRLEVEA